MLRKELDNCGLPCPQPVINTKKALEELAGKGGSNFVLTVLVDNEAAKENVTRFAKAGGFRVAADQKDNLFRITIESGQGRLQDNLTSAETEDAAYYSMNAPADGLVYLIKSKTLGEGSEELGTILMRGFVFTIRETSPQPAKMLFLNSGVYLTTEGSPVLEELLELAKLGVEIYSCGTCLDYFQVTDKLKVGSITNMYDTVENLVRSGKCISI